MVYIIFFANKPKIFLCVVLENKNEQYFQLLLSCLPLCIASPRPPVSRTRLYPAFHESIACHLLCGPLAHLSQDTDAGIRTGIQFIVVNSQPYLCVQCRLLHNLILDYSFVCK